MANRKEIRNSTAGSDGKNYQNQFYNLDAIISVGYRGNSVFAGKLIVSKNDIGQMH